MGRGANSRNNSMKQISSWKFSCRVSKEFASITEPVIYCVVHENLALYFTSSYMDLIHMETSNFSTLNFRIILPCKPRGVKLCLLTSLANNIVYADSFFCFLWQVHICLFYCIPLDLIILITSSKVCALRSLLCSFAPAFSCFTFLLAQLSKRRIYQLYLRQWTMATIAYHLLQT
jgi:hypothetical protein